MATPISIVNGEYKKNAEAYTSAPGTVVDGDTIRVRALSSVFTYNQTVAATLTVGSYSTNFSITTKPFVPEEFVTFTFEVVIYPDFIDARYRAFDSRPNSFRFLQAGVLLGSKKVASDLVRGASVATYTVTIPVGTAVTTIESYMTASSITTASSKQSRIYYNGTGIGASTRSFPVYPNGGKFNFTTDTALVMPNIVNGDVVRLEHGNPPEPTTFGVYVEVRNLATSVVQSQYIAQYVGSTETFYLEFPTLLDPGDTYTSPGLVGGFVSGEQLRVHWQYPPPTVDGTVWGRLYVNGVFIDEYGVGWTDGVSGGNGQFLFDDVVLEAGDSVRVDIDFVAGLFPNFTFDSPWEFEDVGYNNMPSFGRSYDQNTLPVGAFWSVEDDGYTLRVDWEDSINCGGTNGQVQHANATVNITATEAQNIGFDWEGLVENSAGTAAEEFQIYIDGVEIASATNANTAMSDSCTMVAPVITDLYPSGYPLTTGSHVITIVASTRTNLFHTDSYFKFTFKTV